MAAQLDLKVDQLNFQGIRENLKSFLRSQSQFKDINFDASGIAVLLDTLAYNTYYNAFYLNMASTEAFLSTAQRRNSVVNQARSINYTPRSVSSARITGKLTLTAVGTPASVIVPKYTRFSASVDEASYYFNTMSTLTFFRIDNEYVLDDITLVEGRQVLEKYVKNSIDSNQRFIISNDTIDISTLTVRVVNSSSDSTVRVFNRSDNIVNVNGDSLVYFLQEVEDGKYEILFGDDTIGKSLDNGNIIYMEYLISSGPAGNDAQVLELNSGIAGVSSITFEPVTPSYGGDARESIERIRFNAPKSYAAQNRAITSEDYLSFVLQYPNVQSAIVWGGEDNDPPYYGRVFVAVKPKVSESLTAIEKANLIDYTLGPKKIITTSVEIVDPEYIYLIINATVKYDSTQNVLNSTSIQSLVVDTIKNYNANDLGEFSKYFRYSKLSRLIDTCERSILNSILSVRMKKEVDIQLGTSSRYEIRFSNALSRATASRPDSHPFNAGNQVTSNEFTYNGLPECYLEDNGGLIRVYRKSGVNFVGVASNVGTIDYDTGYIILPNFTVDSFADGGTTLKLIATPSDMDILPLRTQIIQIRDQDISVTVVDDNTISLTKR